MPETGHKDNGLTSKSLRINSHDTFFIARDQEICLDAITQITNTE